MATVTAAEVREISGVGSDITADATITSIIDEVELKLTSLFNVTTSPTKQLEIKNGTNKHTIMISKPYLMKILAIEIQDNSIDLENMTFDPWSGIITIDNSTNPYIFSAYTNSVKIKYLSGFMEPTTTITESTTDEVAGTSVSIAVDSESGFTTNDWVMIEGLDGKREAFKVSSTTTGIIVADQLVQTHKSGSVLTKLKTQELLRQFVLYESAIATGINAMGGSYNFATGYTLPEYSVQKGEPYPSFQRTVQENTKIRDEIKAQIFNKISAVA